MDECFNIRQSGTGEQEAEDGSGKKEDGLVVEARGVGEQEEDDVGMEAEPEAIGADEQQEAEDDYGKKEAGPEASKACEQEEDDSGKDAEPKAICVGEQEAEEDVRKKEAGPPEASRDGEQEEKDFGTEAEPEAIRAGEQQAEDEHSEKEADLEARVFGKQAAEQDSGKKEAAPEAKGHGEWKDGCKNADAAQYGKKPSGIKITKYCSFFYNADGGGCQRGDFCTFAHSEADMRTEWFDRNQGSVSLRTMVLCKFWPQGMLRDGWLVEWLVGCATRIISAPLQQPAST